MTIEQQYEAIKAEFINLSKAIHLAYNTYNPQFELAADCVRAVFRAEPIHNGRRRSTIENQATQALTAIMKSQTDINDAELARMLLKKDHSVVAHNMKQHNNLHEVDEHYRNRYNSALIKYIETKCNTFNT